MRDALNGETHYQYDAHGNLVSTTDALGHLTTFGYDALGRMVLVTDALGQFQAGHSVSYAYDAADNLTSVADQLGNQTHFAYDKLGRLALMTDALAHETRYEYDRIGNLIRVTKPGGAATNFAYDGLNRLTTLTNALGNTTGWTYDAAGNAIEMIDAIGRKTRYVYDARDRVTSVTDYLDRVTRYAYDSLDNVTQVTNARGYRTRYVYDVLSEVIKITDATIATQEFDYDVRGDVVGSTDQRGNRTEFRRDALGRLTTIVDPLTHLSSFDYDAVGNLVHFADANGHGASYSYDALYRVTQQTDPIGGVQHFNYDAASNLLTHTDQVGRQSSYEYNALGQVTVSIDALGYAKRNTFDQDGNLIRVDGRDAWAGESFQTLDQFEYDAFGQLIHKTDALGGVWSFAYDAVGRVVSRTDPMGMTSSCNFGGSGDSTSVVGVNGHTDECTTGGRSPGWKYTYDEVDNLVAVVDPLGDKTVYAYDPLDRTSRITDARAGRTQFLYDPAGNLVRLTDPAGNDTAYDYDKVNRVTRETNELGASRWYEYHAVGNVSSICDRNGRRRDFSYDALNRLTGEGWKNSCAVGGLPNPNDNVIGYSNDGIGRLTSAIDVGSSYLTFSYDDTQRQVTADNLNTPTVPHVVLTSTFDGRGLRTKLDAAVPDLQDFTNDYQYDLLGRMTRVDQHGPAGIGEVLPKRVDFAYNAVGQFTTISRYSGPKNGSASSLVATTTLDYDNLERLTGITHVGADLSTGPSVNYSYAYDALDRITTFAGPDDTATYSYDATSQLVGAQHTSQPNEGYSYDLNGNRTNSGYVTQGDNQLVHSVVDGHEYSYAYDAEGNMTVRIDVETDGRTEYTWDHRNRLTRVELKNSHGDVERWMEFSYDALNRRIMKMVGPDGPWTPQGVIHLPTEYYVYDGGEIALVYFDFDGPDHEFVPQLRSRLLYGPAIDQVLADESLSVAHPNPTEPPVGIAGLFWLLGDHQGTIRDVVNSYSCTGNGHIAYTAFGRIYRVTNGTGDPLALSLIGSHRFLYTGREFDFSLEYVGGDYNQELSLQYNRARYYDAAIGRWLSQDPIGFGGADPNLYRYVANDPSNFTDPSGLRQRGKRPGNASGMIFPIWPTNKPPQFEYPLLPPGFRPRFEYPLMPLPGGGAGLRPNRVNGAGLDGSIRGLRGPSTGSDSLLSDIGRAARGMLEGASRQNADEILWWWRLFLWGQRGWWDGRRHGYKPLPPPPSGDLDEVWRNTEGLPLSDRLQIQGGMALGAKAACARFLTRWKAQVP